MSINSCLKLYNCVQTNYCYWIEIVTCNQIGVTWCYMWPYNFVKIILLDKNLRIQELQLHHQMQLSVNTVHPFFEEMLDPSLGLVVSAFKSPWKEWKSNK